MFRNRCAVDGCRSAGSRPIACRAGLLVSYRPLVHVRFREETEPVRGETTPPALLRAARSSRRTCSDLHPEKLDNLLVRIAGDPSRRLGHQKYAFNRRDRREPSRGREQGGEDPAELNRKSSRDERGARRTERGAPARPRTSASSRDASETRSRRPRAPRDVKHGRHGRWRAHGRDALEHVLTIFRSWEWVNPEDELAGFSH